ncbi:MAG: endonuclease/exonuclease/phosphatase family protein, partial [Planctomycetota bacterium]
MRGSPSFTPIDGPLAPGNVPRWGPRLARARKVLARLAVVLGVLILTLVVFFLWASAGRQSAGTSGGPVHDRRFGLVRRDPGSLVVMTWNIAYAHGPGSEGKGYAIRPRDESAERLDRIGKAIRDSSADVVLLQEVDFDSDRSHRVDQLEALARAASFRYAAPAVSWRARYVPFPGWSPGGHWGRMESGGAVLSRSRIESNTVTLHPKPSSNSWVYNAFYIFRYSQVVTIRWGKRKLRIVNNHLDAYDRPNREGQARELAESIRGFDGTGGVDVMAGDMNAPPPEAALLHGFPDEPGTDFRGDGTLGILRGIERLSEIDHATAAGDGSDGFT